MLPTDNASHHVVVHDPEDQFWEGAVVPAMQVPSLRARQATTLPIDPLLVGQRMRSAVSGYFRRGWGSGWSIDVPVPRMTCPMALYVERQDRSTPIWWAARIKLDPAVAEAVRAGARPQGSLRLAADAQQAGAFSGGFAGTPDNVVDGPRIPEKFGMPDREDGWVLHGRGLVTPPLDGVLALGLWGHLQGARVLWAAVTQSR